MFIYDYLDCFAGGMGVEKGVNIFVARAVALFSLFIYFGLQLAACFEAHMVILMLEATTLW